ncbi:MAG: hypothetical protein ACJAW1_000045 [Glaciecola sp.]
MTVAKNKGFKTIISNEPLFGKLDWIVGVCCHNTDIEITILEEFDVGRDGVLDVYATTFPDVFGGESRLYFQLESAARIFVVLWSNNVSDSKSSSSYYWA